MLTPETRPAHARPRAIAVLALALLGLSGCGGGDATHKLQCSIPQQQASLRSYMNDWYYWSGASPDPAPTGYSTVASYFQARLYTGTLADFPQADRWSYISTTSDYSLFFDENQNLGYGVMVNGVEVGGLPQEPLRIRYVEPGSPAALAGLQRGDRITTVNGQPASAWVGADDFSFLDASAVGQTLALGIERGTAGSGISSFSVSLSAAVYDLAPVVNTAVLSSAAGRKVGSLMVKDMIDAAPDVFDAAFAQFKAAGVEELVIDLRYNGGGYVSVANALASYVSRRGGADSIHLWFNERHTDSDTTYTFDAPANGLNLNRVYVLSGPRTCSASELVINSLRPYVDVVQVGDVTCGKPVGFVAWDGGCGSVYSIVNFESFNADYEGRYFSGLSPSQTCEVTEDFTQPLGSSSEPLLAAALRHMDSGSCAAAPLASAARRASPLAALGLTGGKGSLLRSAAGQPRLPGWHEPGERNGMRP